MAYYSDLSPCSYFGIEEAPKLIAVGWLNEAHAYPQGQVSEAFLDRLIDLLVKPWVPRYFLGYKDSGRRAQPVRAGRGVSVCRTIDDRSLHPFPQLCATAGVPGGGAALPGHGLRGIFRGDQAA